MPIFGNPEIPDDMYVVLVENDDPEHGGEPICWEHPLKLATLAAAKMVKKRLGNTYGATRIAKLVLIDDE